VNSTRVRASWDWSPHLAARSLTGFDAAGGQRNAAALPAEVPAEVRPAGAACVTH
jgi:hypothetical protein